MVTRVETIVVGGGAMGAATAWQLARRGREVVLLERWEPGHRMGASHGTTRNFNVAYAESTYVAMLAEALPLWRELEDESGSTLLDLVGVANHGPSERNRCRQDRHRGHRQVHEPGDECRGCRDHEPRQHGPARHRGAGHVTQLGVQKCSCRNSGVTGMAVQMG